MFLLLPHDYLLMQPPTLLFLICIVRTQALQPSAVNPLGETTLSLPRINPRRSPCETLMPQHLVLLSKFSEDYQIIHVKGDNSRFYQMVVKMVKLNRGESGRVRGEPWAGVRLGPIVFFQKV